MAVDRRRGGSAARTLLPRPTAAFQALLALRRHGLLKALDMHR